MYALYSPDVVNDRPKLTPPFTVRLDIELNEWLTELSETRNDRRGKSGIINEALAHYKATLEERAASIRGAIGGRYG